MKKITILALHLGYGGIEKCISSLANTLCDNYNVNIICTYKLYDKPVCKLNSKIKVKYLINNDLALKMNEYKPYIKKLQFIKLFKLLYKQKYIFGFIIDIFKSLNIIIKRRTLMIKEIKNCNSDVIISTRDFHNTLLSKYGKKEIKKIAWEHNHHHGNMKYANKIIKSVKRVDYFILVSKELYNFYKEKVNAKCIYIPNTIDYIPKETSKLDNYNLTSVGRLSQEKGYLDLIDVFNLAYQKNKKLHLDIIGDGNEREAIRKKINYYNLNEVIKLHGYQSKEYIDKILLNSSLYVMCSYTESFGIVLLEAFSYGIPCIAFDSAEGANEIIDNNVNGFLIKNRNNINMASKINSILEDRKSLKHIGIKAKEKALKYDIKIVIKEWSKILDE